MEAIKLRQSKVGWTFYQGETDLLAITEELYFQMHLYEKESFTQEDLALAAAAMDYKKGRKIAAFSNRYKNKSKKALEQKLLQQEIGEATAKRIVSEMSENGEIDEADLIRRFVRERMKLKPRPKNFLKYELLKKGFEGELVESILEEVNLCDEAIAKAMLQKKKTEKMTAEEIVKYLKYKGFNFHTIKKVIEDHLQLRDMQDES